MGDRRFANLARVGGGNARRGRGTAREGGDAGAREIAALMLLGVTPLLVAAVVVQLIW